MASLVAQKIISLLQKNLNTPQSNDPSSSCPNCTPGSRSNPDDKQLTSPNSSSSQDPKALASDVLRGLSSSKDISSLLNLFYSSSAARDWLKVFVYGSLLEMLRRLVLYVYGKGKSSLFITATFTEYDDAYMWVCYWLSRQPAWYNARELEVTRHDDSDDEVDDEEKEVTFLPSMDSVYTMWYKGHWMRVSRFQKEGHHRKYINLFMLAHSHSVLKNLIADSRTAYLDAQRNLIRVYVPRSGSWQLLATRRKRSLGSIILDPGMKDILVQDAKNFLSCKPWYVARGIPFRRGYLLHGAPGSGKTSIIHCLAGELGLDVYIISLSKAGMDDTDLTKLITDLPEKCIALMEDIDAAFSQTINRESSDSDGDDNKSSTSKTQIGPSAPETSKVTLSGLLNSLDGVGAQEGRILFATTNKYNSLDPALCRPGRMDIHVEFRLASRYQARELFKAFYMPNSKEEEKVGRSSESDKEKKQRAQDGPKTNGSDNGISFLEGHAGLPMLHISPVELEKLAEEFADAIPEGEFSMASLQGYLMGYKVTPEIAVKEVGIWMTKERKESKARRKTETPDNGAPVQASDT